MPESISINKNTLFMVAVIVLFMEDISKKFAANILIYLDNYF